MGFIYILKNPSFGDEWVKIGRTDKNDVADRVKTLNNSEATPYGFRIYATYEVENSSMIEREIHGLIDEIHYDLRAREILNGRNRVREFFHISPERAFNIFKRIAALRNDIDKLKLYAPDYQQREDEEDAENLLTRRTRARNTTFAMLGIVTGTELALLSDDSCVCETVDNRNKVKYNEKIFTVSNLAVELGQEKFGWTTSSVNGFEFFTFEGETLWNRRKRIEHELILEDEEN